MVVDEDIDGETTFYNKKYILEKPNPYRPIVPQAYHLKESIKDVKVVILSKNPGYDKRIDEKVDNLDYKIQEQQEILNSLTGGGDFVPWTEPTADLKFHSEESWHRKKIIKPENSLCKEYGLKEKNIMQIEFFPYQTVNGNFIPKEFLAYNSKVFKPLPSQIKNFNIVKKLVTDSNCIFFVRDYRMWKLALQAKISDDDSLSALEDRDILEFENRCFVPFSSGNLSLTSNNLCKVKDMESLDALRKKCKDDAKEELDKLKK